MDRQIGFGCSGILRLVEDGTSPTEEGTDTVGHTLLPEAYRIPQSKLNVDRGATGVTNGLPTTNQLTKPSGVENDLDHL